MISHSGYMYSQLCLAMLYVQPQPHRHCYLCELLLHKVKLKKQTSIIHPSSPDYFLPSRGGGGMCVSESPRPHQAHPPGLAQSCWAGPSCRGAVCYPGCWPCQCFDGYSTVLTPNDHRASGCRESLAAGSAAVTLRPSPSQTPRRGMCILLKCYGPARERVCRL